MEEEIFYPTFRDAVTKKVDGKLYLGRLNSTMWSIWSRPRFRKAILVRRSSLPRRKGLKDLIKHHTKEEEKEMFPHARKVIDREQLQERGGQIEQRKVNLLASQVGQAVQEISRG